MFNYRAAGAAVLIQADRTNVQLQGHRRQRFSYRPTEPTFNYRAAGDSGSHTEPTELRFNYRAFGQGGSVLAERFLNIPRYFLPCHTPAVT